MPSINLTCLTCGTVNRLPTDRTGQKPKCGTCGKPVNTPKVTEIDFKMLTKASKRDQLPLIVDFWAPWCGPCRMMAPEFAKAATDLGTAVRFAKINTEDEPAASQRHNIRGIPSMIMFKNGKEIARQSGAMRSDQIKAWVNSNLA
ncbi:MAG: thioredoxin TrxC [Rhodobacteraceae bacterium]|nr:thioredoxin TrxC [Paracoccaceae bacterium]